MPQTAFFEGYKPDYLSYDHKAVSLENRLRLTSLVRKFPSKAEGKYLRWIQSSGTREAQDIAERKKTLAAMLANVAELGAGRMEATIGKASLRDAAIGTGIAIDKMLALAGQTPAVQIANIVLPTEEERAERRALHDKLDEIARRLAARQIPQSRDE